MLILVRYCLTSRRWIQIIIPRKIIYTWWPVMISWFGQGSYHTYPQYILLIVNLDEDTKRGIQSNDIIFNPARFELLAHRTHGFNYSHPEALYVIEFLYQFVCFQCMRRDNRRHVARLLWFLREMKSYHLLDGMRI